MSSTANQFPPHTQVRTSDGLLGYVVREHGDSPTVLVYCYADGKQRRYKPRSLTVAPVTSVWDPLYGPEPKTTIDVLRRLDTLLASTGIEERHSMHWGFTPCRGSLHEENCSQIPWPDHVAVAVATGPNEGWMVHLFDGPGKPTAAHIAQAKFLSDRADAFSVAEEIARLLAI